jgi:DNA (cytosine-5)-methyltransferase 1
MLTYGSLFSGIGCNDIALHQFLGWEAAFYVEKNTHCISCIESRIGEEVISDSPIWDDVTTFDGKPWGGLCDCIIGGDPCQSNSAAAQTGEHPQSLADAFIRIVSEIRPSYVIRENPSKVRASAPSTADYFCDRLEGLGYRTQILEVRASDMGADHRRARLFVCASLVYPDSDRPEREVWAERESVAERWLRTPSRPTRWTAPPRILRSTDGFARRTERLRAIGNGATPAVVAVVSAVCVDEGIVF